MRRGRPPPTCVSSNIIKSSDFSCSFNNDNHNTNTWSSCQAYLFMLFIFRRNICAVVLHRTAKSVVAIIKEEGANKILRYVLIRLGENIFSFHWLHYYTLYPTKSSFFLCYVVKTFLGLTTQMIFNNNRWFESKHYSNR